MSPEEKESAHSTALRNQDKLKKLAAERFRVVNGKVEKYKAAPPARDIEAVVAEAVAAAAAAEERARLASLRIGDMIEGHGIFFGTWEAKDATGKSLGKIFNLFAAPEDLPGDKTYQQAAEDIAGLKNWHGHDGTPYMKDEELYEAVRNDAYNGGWFIPPREMLHGYDARGMKVAQDNIMDHQNTGAFKGTFQKDGGLLKCIYWSSTQYPYMKTEVYFYNVRLFDHWDGFEKTNSFPMSCRPVRLEPKL